MSASFSFQVSGPVPVLRALGVKLPVDTDERCVHVHVLHVDFEGQLCCYSRPCLGRRTQQQLAASLLCHAEKCTIFFNPSLICKLYEYIQQMV
jgi:hypothetical protein